MSCGSFIEGAKIEKTVCRVCGLMDLKTFVQLPESYSIKHPYMSSLYCPIMNVSR